MWEAAETRRRRKQESGYSCCPDSLEKPLDRFVVWMQVSEQDSGVCDGHARLEFSSRSLGEQ